MKAKVLGVRESHNVSMTLAPPGWAVDVARLKPMLQISPDSPAGLERSLVSVSQGPVASHNQS